jgi:hypothetical protein
VSVCECHLDGKKQYSYTHTHTHIHTHTHTDVFDDVSRSFGGRQKPIDGYQGVGLLDDEGPVPRPYQQEAGPGPQSSSEAILLS